MCNVEFYGLNEKKNSSNNHSHEQLHTKKSVHLSDESCKQKKQVALLQWAYDYKSQTKFHVPIRILIVALCTLLWYMKSFCSPLACCSFPPVSTSSSAKIRGSVIDWFIMSKCCININRAMF